MATKDWKLRVDNSKKRKLKSSIILGWGRKNNDDTIVIKLSNRGNYRVVMNTFNDIGVASNLTMAKKIAKSYMRRH